MFDDVFSATQFSNKTINKNLIHISLNIFQAKKSPAKTAGLLRKLSLLKQS